MSRDKYGVENDPACYPGTSVLKNLLGIRDETELSSVEITLTTAAASTIEFQLPPYNFPYLKNLHRHLFKNIYSWAGHERECDISKGETRFCTVSRIGSEANKIFQDMENCHWLTDLTRDELVSQAAEYFGDLNMVHPFREGNGRALRLLFEHLIINVGYEVDWGETSQDEWLPANIAAVACDYSKLAKVFDKCIGT